MRLHLKISETTRAACNHEIGLSLLSGHYQTDSLNETGEDINIRGRSYINVCMRSRCIRIGGQSKSCNTETLFMWSKREIIVFSQIYIVKMYRQKICPYVGDFIKRNMIFF